MKRARYGNGQLKPMRLTPEQALLRMAKTEVRMAMRRDLSITRALALASGRVIFERNIIGRLKWLVAGR